MSSVTDRAATTASGTVLEDTSPEVVRVYADALLNAATKQEAVEGVLEELDSIVSDVLQAHPQFARLLSSPALSEQDRDRVLVDTFEGRASPIVTRFLRVLNHHGRLDLLAAIARQARTTWERKQNRQRVTVRSAVPLDQAQQEALLGRLAQLTGASPIMHLEIDPGLIGGLVVQVGDDVYDASVRNRLEQLRRSLIEGKTHEIQSRRDHFSHPA